MTVPLQLLRSTPMFAGLGDKEAQRVANLFKERTFSAGDVIAEEGEGGAAFFVVESGTAVVSVKGEARGTLGPGSHFGEIALIDGGPRSATITAETELKCHGLTPWEFRPLVQTDANIAWELLVAVAKMLRSANTS